VFAFGLEERTFADWQCKAGAHAKAVQEQIVCRAAIDVGKCKAMSCMSRPKA
jgi:hypothetical protein